MKFWITAAFVVASMIAAMLVGKSLASTKDFMTRAAIIIASFLLWTAAVWLLLLLWRNAVEQ
jgi:hypothetical protein